MFLLSLTQESFSVNNEGEYLGVLVLIYGFMAMFSGGISIVWWANMFIVISGMYYKTKKALFFSFLTFMLALSFFLFDKIQIGFGANKIGEITGYGTGYFLWLASFIIMTFGIGFNYKKLK